MRKGKVVSLNEYLKHWGDSKGNISPLTLRFRLRYASFPIPTDNYPLPFLPQKKKSSCAVGVAYFMASKGAMSFGRDTKLKVSSCQKVFPVSPHVGV